MKAEEHTNVNVKNMVEEIELRQEESVAAKRLKKVEQQFNGQCLGQEDATYNDEQIYSNSITGESSDNTVNERHSCVQGMIQKFESLRKENVAVKGLEKIEQQFNNQHLEQNDATYNDEQISSNSITGEGINNSGIYTKTNESTEEINAQNKNGCTSLREKRRERLVRRNNGLNLNGATCNDEQTFLNDSSISNDSGIYVPTEEAYKELVKYLKEDKENVNEQDGDGRTRLHFAVVENNEELVELLIAHGANIDMQNKDGLTPLHYAVADRNEKLVKLLIEYGANIDAQDKDKRTPLYLAAKYSYVEIIKCLADSGASVNTQDKDGYTPLYFINKYIKIIKSLKLEQSEATYIRESENKLKENIAEVVDFSSKHERELNDQLNLLAKEKKNLESKVERLRKKVDRLKRQQTNTQQKLNDKDSRIQELEDSDKELKLVNQKLEKAQEDLERLKGFLAENETRLEAFNKLYEENKSLKQKVQNLERENAALNGELEETKNQHSSYIAEHEAKLKAFNKLYEENKSLKQKIKDLESKNVTLNSELEKNKNQHSQTSEVSLKKVEKKPPLSKVAYVSLVATSVVGSILSIVSGLFVLSIIATSVAAALVAGGITYKMSKPTTELKEVNIQSPDNNKACAI